MSRIKDVNARQLFDSLGNPTIEVEVETDDGFFRAMVPSGTSKGRHEAKELRDEDPAVFNGNGVLKAINNVSNELAVAIINMDPTDQEGIDQALMDVDGSDDGFKSRLGANAILGVSMAVARAGAAKKNIPLHTHINNLAGNPTPMLPVPCFNVLNGGSHAGNRLPMQEFLVMPTGAESFQEAMRIGVEVYHKLRDIVADKYGPAATAVGDQGGFAPDIVNPEEALQLIKTAVDEVGYTDHVQIGIDVAASQMFDRGSAAYNMNYKDVKARNRADGFKSVDELLRMYKLYAANYSVISIEDPFDQDDFESFEKMTAELGEVIQIVGDDLLASKINRIEIAAERSSCNALLLKLNEIGTLTEAIEANNLCRDSGFGVMVSSRCGDTEDSFIADLCVGLGTGQIKAGAPCRSERLAKYNQLLRIEQELGEKAAFAGEYWRDPWMLQADNRASSYV